MKIINNFASHQEIRAARGDLTQSQAAALLDVSLRTWQRYEADINVNPKCRRKMKRKHLEWFFHEKAIKYPERDQ